MSEIVVVQANGLTKRYGTTLAVDEVDLMVQRGTFVGVAGRRGAGKSTLALMLAGALRPDAGTASLDGVEVWPDPEAARRVVGSLADRPPLFDRLTVSEHLEYAGLLRGLKPRVVHRRARELQRMLGLDGLADALVGDCLPSQRRRTALATALIHAPVLLIADEPFAGLSADETRLTERVLQRFQQAGGTVLATSDDFEALQRTADRVVVLEAGRVVADGTPAELGGNRGLRHVFGGGETAGREEGSAWLSPSSASS
ncbi:MAG TPA: ABC transporter ATP-binding protein [Propionicimonas sp.]|jgi:ABC-2 type transport system ATP-binding protein|nr:ABC transporter ATP-binding protein [Propionicimonas sp.]